MGRIPKDLNGLVTPRQNIMFRARPIDCDLINFLRKKSTLSVSQVIREALAYRAESLGMDIGKLVEEHGTMRERDESTPA